MIKVYNVLFDDRYGGPQKRVISIAKYLYGSSVHTVLCIPDRGGIAEEQAQRSGVAVKRIPMGRMPKLGHWHEVFFWTFTALMDTARFIATFRKDVPDIVHVNGAVFFPPAIAAKACGIPLIWHLNDTLLPRLLSKILGAVISMLSSCVVCSCESVTRHYGLIDANCVVLRAPVDLNAYYSIGEDDSDGRDNTISIGIIANWNPLKGLDTFVRAMAVVNEKSEYKIRGYIAGAKLDTYTEYADLIQSIIISEELQKVIVSLGFVDDVPSLLRRLDCVVSCSISEACPMAVLESMAARLPVISTDVGGARELLNSAPNKHAGIVVQAGDHVMIAEAILNIIEDKELSVSLGRQGRKIIEESFSLQKACDDHLKLYRSLVA